MSTKPRIVTIVQARMGSTRLPGKVMADIAGKPMIYHVIKRAQAAEFQDLVAVATSESADDDTIGSYCQYNGVPCYRGSLDDVLDRYYRAAIHFRADAVIRITADCPVLDPSVTDKVIRVFLEGHFDYVSNTVEPSFPDGLDVEIMRFEALHEAWLRAKLRSEREHVTPYIWKNPAIFRIGNVRNDRDLSTVRWTVDEPEDLNFIRKIFDYFRERDFFLMQDVLDLIARVPDLRYCTPYVRNAGYLISLENDFLDKS